VSEWKIRFGTAGTSDSFAAQGYKTSLDVPEYTAKMGLNAFEYQCGRGVRLGLDKAAKMAALAQPKDILFSVHAPYYISMSSLEEDKRLNSIQYLLQSAAVCKALGGRRIIFHSGSCGKQSREAALEKALDTMRRAVEALDAAGFADMTLCPETMGKIGQLGTGRGAGPVCGGQAHHPLHRLRPPERPHAGRHPEQSRLCRHPRPYGRGFGRRAGPAVPCAFLPHRVFCGRRKAALDLC